MKEDKEVIISELRSKLAQYKENETKIKGILLQIGSLSSGVVRGNLERRLDLSKFPKTWQTIGNNVNKMVESIQLNIQELKNRDKALSSTISSFGSVLSAASAGDLTTKIDLSKISEEYRSIGEDINSMIVSFNQIVDTIQNASVEVSDKAQKMATVSEETTLAMEEIAESTKLIAVAAEKQST
ncbi:MAG TPA: methyl-accepting chemotaxis protein, partial [Thermoplasmata archaeon]|nr:methyl-accepting chemotaxis protein [Thermoplasmata archaeon]